MCACRCLDLPIQATLPDVQSVTLRIAGATAKGQVLPWHLVKEYCVAGTVLPCLGCRVYDQQPISARCWMLCEDRNSQAEMFLPRQSCQMDLHLSTHGMLQPCLYNAIAIAVIVSLTGTI